MDNTDLGKQAHSENLVNGDQDPASEFNSISSLEQHSRGTEEAEGGKKQVGKQWLLVSCDFDCFYHPDHPDHPVKLTSAVDASLPFPPTNLPISYPPLYHILSQVRFSANLPPTRQSRFGDLAEEDKQVSSLDNHALMPGSTSKMRRRQVHKLMGPQKDQEWQGRRAISIPNEGDSLSGVELFPHRRYSEPQIQGGISYLMIR